MRAKPPPAAPAGNGIQARTATPAPDVIVTPPAAPPDGPRLGDLVMASGVDSSDCAIDNNPRFNPQQQPHLYRRAGL